MKLTQSQLAIYYESINKPGEPVYIISPLLILVDDIDLDRLRTTVDAAIALHPVLSMVISKDDDGMPDLVDAPAVKCEIERVDDDQMELLKLTLPTPFNLDGGNLFEAKIYQTPSRAYLHLAMHHIIADGTSVGILTRTIVDAYNGRPLTSPPLNIADVQQQEDDLRRTDRLEEARKWHLDTFGGIESDSKPLPDILTAEPSEGSVLDHLVRKSVVLTAPYAEAFAKSRALEVPLSVLVDGAFGYMLGCWSASNESLFATIFAGRKTPEEQAVMGMMVKTVPMYCRWEADTTVSDYIKFLAAQHATAKDYADTYSFAELCAETGCNLGINFSYRGSIQAENIVIDSFSTGSLRLGHYTTGDTMQFLLDHIDDHFTMTVEYRDDLYTPQMIESLIDSYDMVLNGFLSQEHLADIELCSPAMLERLESFNTATDHIPAENIVELFERHAATNPDKVALITADEQFTYRQVADISSRLATHIGSLGIGPNDCVSIMVDRNEWMLMATMGALRAATAYQPLDPSYPPERLNFMMRDADVRLLIADRHLELELEEDLREKVTILYTDEIESLPSAPQGAQLPSVDPDGNFILLYTSGTTGVPKGVQLTHRNLRGLIGAHQAFVPQSAEPSAVWAMYASYGFDAGFFSLLLPIAYGASVAIVPDALRLDMEGLNDFFMRKGVTFVFMTTQVGRIFATTIDTTSVRTLMVGGEKLVPCAPPESFDLYNIYGPTEGTVYCNSIKVDRLYTRVPIGRPLADYKNYIVDSHNRRLPLGALGELVIAGPQVGAGYLNLPEASERSFRPNPFSDDPMYSQCYRSGDIVRILPANGVADIIGRNDGQVKIRGFRIELSEVEKVIREYPGITDATVQAYDNPAGGKFIAAYIVAPQPIDVKLLEEFIGQQKPHYMVPEVTMQIDAIPLTQNQKVNKRALPVPTPGDTQSSLEGNDDRQPNLLERIICDIVADTLGIDSIGLNVELSRMGLTSISSIRLASRLFKRFGITFKGAELVKHATVVTIEDDILQHLLEQGTAAEMETKLALSDAPTAAPLSVSQQGVYADTMRNPGTTSYNIPLYFRFDASTDAHALADAVKRVIDAHPYLRDVHLTLGNDDIEQSVLPSLQAEVTVKEMTEPELEEYRRHFIMPFNLMQAPLYRLEVVKTPEAVYLLMDVQHLVFDGSSLTIMLNQLKGLLEGGTIEPETLSYLDYTLAERDWLNGAGGEEAATFFKNLLSDCEAASDIPSDRPQGLEPGERGIVSRAVDMGAVERFCQNHDMTPAALFMAAACYATARFTSSKSAFLSTISAGRGDVRFADTFGMFVKTLPVAMTIGDGTALEYALHANRTLASVVEREMYPYVKICADYNYAPNIVYEYQYGLVDNLTIGGHKVERHLFDIDTLKFKIAIHVEEIGGQPCVAVHYRKGIYSDQLMTTFCGSIATVAASIMANPAQPIRQLSMVTPQQLEILDRYAYTELTEPSDACLHNLMERQAELHPDRKAIVAVDRTLTYSELDRLANIVANNLIARGVKRGDKVVLLLSRTSRFFSSLYGVLKTGAAYIPSSPDYPDERKRSIIEDADAAYVITDDNVEELHQGDNDTKPAVAVSPDDIVYLIYTSGSTGKPKGVLLRHRGIVNYVTPAESVIHTHAIVTRATTVGSITTVAFDMALKEWGIALSHGLTLVFASDEQSNDPVALASLFTRNGVDYFNTTPSRMQQYMELDEFCDMLRGCKVIICGAEKYPEYLVQRLREVAPDAQIFNTYGPTEITVSSNACDLTHQPSVSVGRPLRNYIEHIVDNDDNILPPGVIGELLISGWNIAQGYNNNPEQTAKAFIEYMGRPTYRSGDYARWDADGNVEILGRKDTQVKLRGLRIELGEIERVMGAIDAIAVSHIMIRNVAGRENLVAYYTLKNGCSMSADEIKELMAAKLTDYMVPSFLVEMEQMPLTPNGKINTRALPEPIVAEREAGRSASNDLEQFFIDVFKNILGTDTVYADDSFFALGGTSLTATRVMIAASKAGHHIIYADIFANPTPASLAALLGATPAEPSEDTAVGDTYDYTAINQLLQSNTLDSFRSGKRRELGTVLLTGATGFAGIHVLRELLSQYDVDVVCLGRDSRTGVPAEERISQLYFYYFGESLSVLFPGRVHVVKGDITRPLDDSLADMGIKTVINCAANVKHFSAGTDIEDINYYGVLNLIDWCKAHGAALVQTSTVSVTGRQKADRDEVLDERSLYIGQDFADNKYITSKFMAERAVLEATAKGEIIGKVVRLGNLAPRERDGEFQINFRTNGFMNRLKSIQLVGCYPYSMYAQQKDISPIDDVARAIVLFAQTPDACVVFHGNNSNRYALGNFYHEAAKAGLDMHPVETDEFVAALEQAKNDPEKLPALVGLMAYEGMGDGLKPVDYSNSYSGQVLLRMGFHWPTISSEYVGKLIRALDGLGFFLM